MKPSVHLHNRKLAWFAGSAIAAAVIILPAALDRPQYKTYGGTVQWHEDAAFARDNGADARDLPAEVLQADGTAFWRNYSTATGVRPGKIETSFFQLRSRQLVIPIVGSPSGEESRVYIETESGRQFSLPRGNAYAFWRPATVSLPQQLVNRSVRIVASSQSPNAYVGVGTPYFRSNHQRAGAVLSQIAGATSAAFLYLLLIFYPAFRFLGKCRSLSGAEKMLATVIVTSCLTIPLFFFAYYHCAAGRLLVHVLIAGSAVLLCKDILWQQGRDDEQTSARPCIILLGGLLAFQALFVFSFNTASVDYTANDLFYPAAWSVDNQIPTVTARLLARGTSEAQWPFGPWRLSDRTPLLANLLYPAAVLSGDLGGHLGNSSESMFLQMCAFGVLNAWLLPVWIFLRRLQFSRREVVLGILLMAATPFVFFNAVYVWPKLLTATFCLTQLIYLLPLSDQTPAQGMMYRAPVLAGIAGAMAILAHAGSGIASLAIIIVVPLVLSTGSALRDRQGLRAWTRSLLVNSRGVAICGAVMAALVAPWLVWTKYGAPSSNALPKYFLTGGFGFANPTQGVLGAARQFYATMTPHTWLLEKWHGVQALAGFYYADLHRPFGTVTGLRSGLDAVRAFQFLYLVPSLGLLVIPVAAFFVMRRRELDGRAGARLLNTTLAAALLAFALQFVLMMSPHLLHHYPYYVPFALQLLAVTGILIWKESAIMRTVAIGNYLLFVFLWIGLTTLETEARSPGALALSLALGVIATVIVGLLLFGGGTGAEQRQDGLQGKDGGGR